MTTLEETQDELNDLNIPERSELNSPKKTDAFDLDTDEELSELDEEQFKDLKDAQIEKSYLNEYSVHELPKFKRKPRLSNDTIKPKKGKSIKKRRRGTNVLLSRENIDESRNKMDPAEMARWELDQALNEAIISSRKKKRKDEDLEEIADDEIIALREKMRQAAIDDAQANAEKKPATHKLKMLSEVESALRKTSFTESILDNNLLEVVRIWLEPLPDRSLPALNIQKVLFSALSRLPIQTEHLRESAEWSRPIIKRSSNYRDRSISTVPYNPDIVIYNQQKITDNVDISKNTYKKTIIPTPINASYEIAPKVHLKMNHTIPKTRNDDHLRKLKQKMQKMKQLGKRNGVSIEGRKLT
ncbi:hypothetical protein PCANB_003041 [Pneumocystis canis]|nr:hypothetical protein PCANB_003041 [Pneumocystis canis]